jgi:hypothetical protein
MSAIDQIVTAHHHFHQLREFHLFRVVSACFSSCVDINCGQLSANTNRTGQGTLEPRSCRYLDVTRRAGRHRSDRKHCAGPRSIQAGGQML